MRRVAVMLSPLGSAKGWEILQELENGDSQDRATGEIVGSGAI